MAEPELERSAERLRDQARQLDSVDPLAHWRDEFFVADDELAYLDGNSLGMPPRRTEQRLTRLVRDEWGRGLISSWEHWIDLPQRVGDQLAPLIGASAGEVVVHDSTTVNLYQLVVAAAELRPDRRIIAVDAADFPTDRYVVAGVAARLGWQVREGLASLDGVGVVVRSMVDYRTAAIADIAAETERARAVGALTVWDLSHAAGVHPVGLNAANADFAVGCTYKFLNGGPGAPAFSFVRRELIEDVNQPIHGWFGQVDQFAMGATYAPRPDIGRLLLGTPNIIGLTAAQCGIEVTAEAGVDPIRRKSIELGRFGVACCDELGLLTTAPRDDDRRGGHVCVHHPEARAINAALASHRVLADFREPDIIRLGCSPLTTRFSDVAQATIAIATLAR